MTAQTAEAAAASRIRKACQRLAEQMLALARKAGADGAEVLVRDGAELEVKVRLGETELIKEAGSRALGLRVIKDERSAVTYTSDLTTAGLERLARDSVELAALAEPDPDRGAAGARGDGARRARAGSVGRGRAVAGRRRRDPARARGRGGGAGVRQARHQLRRRGVRAHGGRVGVRDVGRVFGIGARHARVVRGRADVRRRRRQEAQRIVLDARRGLPARSRIPKASGVEAARRTVAKLGARKIPTGAAPVIFSPDAARGLLGQFAGRDVGRRDLAASRAISRAAKGRRSRRRWSRSSTIRCCGAARARARSTARGSPAATNVLVSEGLLRTFLCDVYAARKLGRRSTGSAARGDRRQPARRRLEPDPAARAHARRRAGTHRSRPLRHRSDGVRLQRASPATTRRAPGGFWIERGERAFPVTRDHRVRELRRAVEGDRRASATIWTRARRCSARRSASSSMMIAGS